MNVSTSDPIVARLCVVDGDATFRAGHLVAKVTYRGGEPGAPVSLDDQAPEPLRADDVPTAYGCLPRDTPRRSSAFEVIFDGEAVARRPTATMRVDATVAGTTRSLFVVGERTWRRSGFALRMSEPEPFTRMPLGWARAFGGTTPVLLDEHGSVLDVSEPRNPAGRGFDPSPLAEGLGELLALRDPYPIVPPTRALPNVERLDAPIRGPEDAPEPISWAAMPVTAGVFAERLQRAADAARGPSASPDEATQRAALEASTMRAQDWVFARCPERLEVSVDGMTPAETAGGAWSFSLPSRDLEVDFALGARRVTRRLEPQRLVVRPSEATVEVCYSLVFEAQCGVDDERSARIRFAGGWS